MSMIMKANDILIYNSIDCNLYVIACPDGEDCPEKCKK